MKASKYLVSKKHLNFKGLTSVQIEKIIILIAVCHDFGKSTVFFQDYIRCKMNGHDYVGNERDKSHSLISGLFGWHMAEKWIKKNENMENRWKVFLPFAVLTAIAGHHGSYSSIEDIISAISEGVDSYLLPKQIENIKHEIFSYSFEEFDLNDGTNFNLDTVKHIQKQLRKFHREYHKEILENQIEQRIFGLLLYSILLESDKAYLASDNPEQYERESIDIPDNIVDKFIEGLDKSAKINEEREKAYCSTTDGIEQFPLIERIHSVTLPTGLGKTLLAASWAIKLRTRLQKNGIIPKLIVSLPFLSIIEQTDKIYKKFLNNLYEHRLDRLYTASYSIADFEYKDGIDKEERSDNSVDFYLSTWNSEIVVTTFDQLLYSIFSLKAKHLMRFHNLFDSILIFDEIQALPSDLWKPFEFFFKKLAEVGNTHILLMSATQPDFFPGAIERVPEHREYFNDKNRVNLNICSKQLSIKDFIENLPPKLNDLYNRSVMIVLNTRMSSKSVYNSVKQAMNNGSIKKRPLIYLSSYVTPAQRIKRIERIHKYIKKCKNPLIITTQCIEAGVDIDIDYIIRDWAPLDSIFQVCGRCNRNGEKSLGIVEIVKLLSENNKAFSSLVYDEKLLESTAFSLNNSTNLTEDKFYDYGTKYFQYVRENLGHSIKVVEAFAKYSHKYQYNGREETVNIKKLLRGDEWQEQFIVSSFDNKLSEDIKVSLAIEDRWNRRYALKRIRKRIMENSINVKFKKWMPNSPDNFTDYSIGKFRILDEQFYDKKGVGFNVNIAEKVGGQKII